MIRSMQSGATRLMEGTTAAAEGTDSKVDPGLTYSSSFDEMDHTRAIRPKSVSQRVFARLQQTAADQDQRAAKGSMMIARRFDGGQLGM
jgi:hypothetical protein